MHDPWEIPAFLRRTESPYAAAPPPEPPPPKVLDLPKRNHLGPMAKDLAAHEIAAALRDRPQSARALAALLPSWDARKLRIALRRGLRMHLFERPQGTRTYRLFIHRPG